MAKPQTRPVLFSTTLSPADTATCIASVEKLIATDNFQVKLWKIMLSTSRKN